jgi:hypothetical protein
MDEHLQSTSSKWAEWRDASRDFIMSLKRLPDTLEPWLSIFVLVTVYISSGFNRYFGLALVVMIGVGVFMRVTKRGRWRPKSSDK